MQKRDKRYKLAEISTAYRCGYNQIEAHQIATPRRCNCHQYYEILVITYSIENKRKEIHIIDILKYETILGIQLFEKIYRNKEED